MTVNVAQVLYRLCQENLNARNQAEAAELLGVQPANFNMYINNNNAGDRITKSMIRHYIRQYLRMNNYTQTNPLQAIDALLLQKYHLERQYQRAAFLDVNPANYANWLNNNTYGQTATRNMILKFSEKIERKSSEKLIIPIYEFKRIKPRKNGRSHVLHDEPEIQERFRTALQGKKGLYSFYDSSGKLLYIGKSETDLFREISQQLGRQHSIWLENFREGKIHHYESAYYLSAYEIKNPAFIDDLETLAIRISYNDGTNIDPGSFSS